MQKALDSIGFFFHPIPLGAVALMALNDHYLKYEYPGLITGKLSDFMGVFYFPIFLCAVVLMIQSLHFGEKRLLNIPLIVSTIVLTDLVMILLKLSPPFSQMVEEVFRSYFFEIRIVNDKMDLLALLTNEFTFFYLWLWMKRGGLSRRAQN